jgi:hypothetical protein
MRSEIDGLEMSRRTPSERNCRKEYIASPIGPPAGALHQNGSSQAPDHRSMK